MFTFFYAIRIFFDELIIWRALIHTPLSPLFRGEIAIIPLNPPSKGDFSPIAKELTANIIMGKRHNKKMAQKRI